MNYNGSDIEFEYYVDAGNRLTEISFVILVLNNTLPTDISSMGFIYNTYDNNLNLVTSAAPAADTFFDGFNVKCIIGKRNYNYLKTDFV